MNFGAHIGGHRGPNQRRANRANAEAEHMPAV
jgi:hypothetical protein